MHEKTIRDGKRRVVVGRSEGGMTLDVPRLFTVEGIEHAVILTVGVVIFGAVIQSDADMSALLPPPLNAHPGLSFWAVLLGGYALFLLLCLMGVGSKTLWRMGELGKRGSFVALSLYSVHVAVSPSSTEITEQCFLRRQTRRFPTGQITSVTQEACGLTVTVASGRTYTWWFSLYPATVKRMKREIERAVADACGGKG